MMIVLWVRLSYCFSITLNPKGLWMMIAPVWRCAHWVLWLSAVQPCAHCNRRSLFLTCAGCVPPVCSVMLCLQPGPVRTVSPSRVCCAALYVLVRLHRQYTSVAFAVSTNVNKFATRGSRSSRQRKAALYRHEHELAPYPVTSRCIRFVSAHRGSF